MTRVAFAAPGDLATPTGGYGYDRRVIAELRALGWQVDVLSLGDGFPRPNAEQRAVALSRLMSLPEGVPVVVDGLALGALPEEAKTIARRAKLVALVHHPLALETGLSPEDAETLFESERAALAAAHAVIVTSPATGRWLGKDYDVPPENIIVAPPGTDRAPSVSPLRGSTPPIKSGAGSPPQAGEENSTVRLLSVGAVVPRKGFDILIAALAPLAALPWRLTIAGDLTRDQGTAASLVADIEQHGFAARIDLLGALPQQGLGTLYSSADVFVLASHFEGYGMAYAEAMAHGLPVIGTTGGATVDTVPPNAGVLVDPGNVKALTRALRMLIEDENARRWFASGALTAAAGLPTWQDTARIVADALEDLRMSGFSAEWLELREPYDLRARNGMVLDAVLDLLAGQPSVAIIDLACGTGSTFRALSPHIETRQNWRLVDNDLSLLARAPPSTPGITVTAAPVDLNRDLEAAFDGPADLVTTSALLDLVSADWLNRLAIEAAARRLPVYAALSYDGRAALAPSDPLDRRIVDAVNRHQRKDKGFGPALGPSAAEAAIAAFECVGYAVTHGLADWEFGPLDREIQAEVLSGWAAAAREIRDPPLPEIVDWLARSASIADGRSSVRVGHVDLLARPTGTR